MNSWKKKGETAIGNYAIIRIEKRKLAAVGRIDRHHERRKAEYKSNPDIDPSRTKYNYHLVEPQNSYRKRCLERIEAVGAKLRKDSVVLQDGLITASPDWLKEKSPEELKQFFDYAFEFIKNRYREENIISAVAHMDEATPHMHFVFVPITEKGRLSSKEVMGGPKGMAQLQNDFYEHIRKRYADIDRGIPKQESHREHVPTHLLKNAEYLYSHYEELCRAINDIGIIGSARKKDEAISLLGKYAPEMVRIREDLKATEKIISRLKGSLDTERQNTAYFKTEAKEKDRTIEEQNAKLYELNRKQKELQHRINLVPAELMERLEKEEKERRRTAQRNSYER